ncbi:ribulose-phosphate 3-epimerase-like isoform X1 [Carlito syrichta]|uniref:ribulose-phosphate 3-epimerase n=1 Tax=Carlito syrichta TaxID=1868482 RepID=A0A1U7T2R7_CARSF|nr:ribulose-phosphate 3-epimerase-like isoform X1 [Carlito syrichta]
MALGCKIGPSILNSGLFDLEAECLWMLDSGSDDLYLNVMEGHFVPNFNFGHSVVESLQKHLGQDLFFDMHMMVSGPKQWVKSMAEVGVDQYIFHLEATENPGDLIKVIWANGMRAGFAVKPETTVQYLAPQASLQEMALVRTVEPGFGGQKFTEDMVSKFQWLRTQFLSLDGEVGGGAGSDTLHMCAEALANMIVSISAIMRSEDPISVINLLRNAFSEAAQRCSLDQ